jgi:hypothetical protein
MDFNRHSIQLPAAHAFLSPSNYHWINYDEDKLDRVFFAQAAARRGTEMHELAQRLIRLGVKLPSNTMTLNQYVNDAIGYRMTPEQILFYSVNCYGTADAICFRNNLLRVHDLKTGTTEASFTQLLVYAALFCMEYKFKPNAIKIELRIYQGDDVRVLEADPDDLFHIIDKIITFDKRLNVLRQEVSF